MKLEDLLTAEFEIELLDLHGLWGGRNVCVSSRGEAWVQSVPPPVRRRRMKERRYVLKLSSEEIERIRRSVVSNDFLSLEIEDRVGLPDEARIKIVLTVDGAEVHRLSVWERSRLSPDEYGKSDRRRFDSIHRELRLIAEKAEAETKPVHSGSFRGIDSWTTFKKDRSKRGKTE
jgi:hypothetical protein